MGWDGTGRDASGTCRTVFGRSMIFPTCAAPQKISRSSRGGSGQQSAGRSLCTVSACQSVDEHAVEAINECTCALCGCEHSGEGYQDAK
jgi:hypothetical protein